MKKSKTRHEPHRKSKTRHEPERKPWRRVGAGFSALLVLVIVIGVVGFRDSKVSESPKEIRGDWVTSDPRYQDCTLEITPYRILFRNPNTRARGNDILEIKKSTEGARSRYEISYEDEEKMVNTITFYYLPAKDGEVIQIKNQEKMKWTRALLPQGFYAEASG